MRDAVAVYKRKTPVVLVAHDKFEKAARLQAKALGAADLPILVIPQPMPYDAKEVEAKKGQHAVQDLKRLLSDKK